MADLLSVLKLQVHGRNTPANSLRLQICLKYSSSSPHQTSWISRAPDAKCVHMKALSTTSPQSSLTSTHIYHMYLSCLSLWYYKSRRTRKCHYIHVLLTPPAWLRALRKDTLERPLPAPRDPLLRVLHEIVDGGRPRGLHVVRLEPRVDGAHEVEELRGCGQYVMRRDGSRWGGVG